MANSLTQMRGVYEGLKLKLLLKADLYYIVDLLLKKIG